MTVVFTNSAEGYYDVILVHVSLTEHIIYPYRICNTPDRPARGKFVFSHNRQDLLCEILASSLRFLHMYRIF